MRVQKKYEIVVAIGMCAPVDRYLSHRMKNY